MSINRPTITGHMVIKNEDKWVWFSIMSVIDFLDKLIIFDTGSVDKTCQIVDTISKNPKYIQKIIFKKYDSVNVDDFYSFRQKQIEMTTTDYFMVIDGDEIWYQDSLNELEKILYERKPDLIATKFINCCGDIFHYQDFNRESYCIKDICGAITIRVYSTSIKGIRCGGKYGVEGYLDIYNKSVQDSVWSIETMSKPYLHTSLLVRSSAIIGDYSIQYRRKKIKQDWDYKFSKEFRYPEVFYWSRPSIVDDPFKKDFNIIRFIYHVFNKIKILLRFR